MRICRKSLHRLFPVNIIHGQAFFFDQNVDRVLKLRPGDVSADLVERHGEEVEALKEKFNIDITETGSNVNDAFLKSNGEESGVATYEVPDSVYVRFYLTHIAGAEDA